VYTITFNAQGGAGSPGSQSITYGTKIGTLPVPTYAGYTFNGWFTEASSGAQYVAGMAYSTVGNTPLYAQWTANGYTITFVDAQLGTVSPAKSVTYNAPTGALPVPTRDGYTFAGWFTAATGGTQYVATTVYSTVGNTTLYARWAANVYTITFNAQGGAVTPGSQSVTYGTATGALSVPTRPGYSFKGWFTAATGGTQYVGGTALYDTVGNTPLYARWAANVYTITFNAQGGAGSPGSQSITYGTATGALPVPTRDGYTFAGWFTAATGGTQYVGGTALYDTVGDMTLYAQWTANVYTITFDAQGGTVSPGSKLVTYGAQTGALPVPTRPGYTFNGWFTAASGGVQYTEATVYRIADDISLFARWFGETQTVCTVTFNSNGGSDISPQPVAAGDKATRPADPTKAGYFFGGWYRDALLSVQWSFPTDVVGSNMTLYASWLDGSQPIYTVRFVSNGGSPVDPQRVAHGGTVTRPADPTRDYYSFGGWYEDDTVFYFPCNFNRKVYESVTVYAKWIAFDIEEARVVINGNVLSPKDDVITCTVPCGDTATLRISLDAIPGNTALIPVNRPYPPDTAITLTSLDGKKKEYTLRVEKPLVFSDIVVVQLGGKLLMAIANPAYNGGFDIKAAQWWKRGDVKVGSKLYYVSSEETASDSLYVRLQDATGAWFSTCPYVPAVASARGGTTREAVYPNPVAAGGMVYLVGDELRELSGLSGLEDSYATFLLFDVQGRPLREGKTSELHQGLTMPATPGIYHILLNGKAGKLQLKVAVSSN
jgi:uncharacterized repeat protein (TIGR02543 family)